MKFKLPQLQKVVSNNKNLPDEEESKLIHVIDGFAYVYNGILVGVDLREYVKKECSIDSPDDIQELDRILNYLNNKSFTKSYWTELTKEASVSFTIDGLEITNDHYTKLLVYSQVVSINTNMNILRLELERKSEPIDEVAVYGSDIIRVIDVFKNEMKTDSFIFKFTGKANAIKFAGRSKGYIFGVISTNYDASEEMFDNFESMVDFTESVFERE